MPITYLGRYVSNVMFLFTYEVPKQMDRMIYACNHTYIVPIYVANSHLQ